MKIVVAQHEKCEKELGTDKSGNAYDCRRMYDCCDCGTKDGCSCPGCFSCNSCKECVNAAANF